MNILQRIIANIFPPYKFNILRKKGSQLFLAIVDSLPDNFKEVKEKSKIGYFQGFSDWKLFPNYKFVSKSYGAKGISQLKKRGEDFKISGLQLFSVRNSRFEEVEILVQNGFVVGLKITNSDYSLDEFDLKNINNQNVTKSDFEFPKSKVDEFYDNLEDEIKSKLNYNDLIETEINGKTYFEFYDLEDGNCFAVDKHLKVFSIIHDAKPMVKAIAISFKELLSQLFKNEFDIEKSTLTKDTKQEVSNHLQRKIKREVRDSNSLTSLFPFTLQLCLIPAETADCKTACLLPCRAHWRAHLSRAGREASLWGSISFFTLKIVCYFCTNIRDYQN